MKRFLSHLGLLCLASLMVFSANAQSTSTITGTVKNSTSTESLSAVSVTVKGGNAGTFTDDKGNFKLSLVQKLPITLVFSSVGFESKEVAVESNNAKLTVTLKSIYVLGSDVTVSASRVAERILESPVSIERVSSAQIKAAPVVNYYDLLANLKGVDVVAASLTFKSISTRGFNGSGNNRLNQLVDGMDNQAPGLNFSVGTMVGLTELDVDNMELLPGASSALYGSGGMNGTVLINSKNPFKYQGLSFQIKQGVNHVDNYQRPQAAYKNYVVRWAQTIGDRFAYKISAEYTEAQDWLANNKTNYSRLSNAATPNGQTIPGVRYNDPNYDGVNVYGDETNYNLKDISALVKAGVSGLVGAPTFNALYGAAAGYTSFAGYTTFLKAATGASYAGLAPYAPVLYLDQKGYYGSVSRTGYDEVDVLDPVVKNTKISGSIHYKINDKTEASFSAYNGSGNTVYTGSDRYSLHGLNMSQFKFEVKSKNWFVRAYKTIEDAGESYNATISARLFNEAWKPSGTWFKQYFDAYTALALSNTSVNEAHAQARKVADDGRPTGNIGTNKLFTYITGVPISKGGGRFLDKSVLNVMEGQYNLTELLGLAKYNADLLVGGSVKGYVLNSQGTLFADTTNRIWINEVGQYAQLSKKFFGDILKVAVSGRYDKNDNFAGRFTPRATAVVKIADDHNVRVSYQQAYRFPTTQNQWINLLVGGGTRLMGGLPQLRKYYGFDSNPAYSLASVLNGAPVQQKFGEFKPESMSSFEIGYKALINKKLLIDFYVYTGEYTNFISVSGVTVLQSRNAANPQLADLADATKRIAYSIATNAPGKVATNGWGLSADYLLPNNFSFSGSVYTDEIGSLPTGFVSYFNTPLFRANFGLNNSGFLLKNRLGFGVNVHYQDDFVYEGTFAVGKISSFNTVDAVLTYKVPKIKSMVKVGGTNIFNRYYQTAYGSPSIGGLYYVSFAYNIL
jgi:outer membrane receptor protein involved in Fe transport